MTLSLDDIETIKKGILKKCFDWAFSKGLHEKIKNFDFKDLKCVTILLNSYRSEHTFDNPEEKRFLNQMVTATNNIPKFDYVPKGYEALFVEQPKKFVKVIEPRIKPEPYDAFIEQLQPIEGRDKPLKDLEGFAKAMKEDEERIQSELKKGKDIQEILEDIEIETSLKKQYTADNNKLMEAYETETGKHAIWRGQKTKGFLRWVRDKDK